MFSNIFLALAILAPATCLAQSPESKADDPSRAQGLGVFSVQRLGQTCGKPGCYTHLYVNGKSDYIPGAWSFDAHCNVYGVLGDWQECQTQVPYTPPGGLFVKMNPWNQTSQTYEFWFSHEYKEGGRKVNTTGRMEVGKPAWEVSDCRQMTVVSKEYI